MENIRSSPVLRDPLAAARKLAARRALLAIPGSDEGARSVEELRGYDPGAVPIEELPSPVARHTERPPLPPPFANLPPDDGRARMAEMESDFQAVNQAAQARMKEVFDKLRASSDRFTTDGAQRFAGLLQQAMSDGAKELADLRARFGAQPPPGFGMTPERRKEIAENMARDLAGPDGTMATLAKAGPRARVEDLPEPLRSQLEQRRRDALAQADERHREQARSDAARWPRLIQIVGELLDADERTMFGALESLTRAAPWLPLHDVMHATIQLGVSRPAADEPAIELALAPGRETWDASSRAALVASLLGAVRTDAELFIRGIERELGDGAKTALARTQLATNAALYRLMHHAFYLAPLASGHDQAASAVELRDQLDVPEPRGPRSIWNIVDDLLAGSPLVAASVSAGALVDPLQALLDQAQWLALHATAPAHRTLPRPETQDDTKAEMHLAVERTRERARMPMEPARDPAAPEPHLGSIRRRLHHPTFALTPVLPAALGVDGACVALYARDPARRFSVESPAPDPVAHATVVALERLRVDARAALQALSTLTRAAGLSRDDFAFLYSAATAGVFAVHADVRIVAALLPPPDWFGASTTIGPTSAPLK